MKSVKFLLVENRIINGFTPNVAKIAYTALAICESELEDAMLEISRLEEKLRIIEGKADINHIPILTLDSCDGCSRHKYVRFTESTDKWKPIENGI